MAKPPMVNDSPYEIPGGTIQLEGPFKYQNGPVWYDKNGWHWGTPDDTLQQPPPQPTNPDPGPDFGTFGPYRRSSDLDPGTSNSGQSSLSSSSPIDNGDFSGVDADMRTYANDIFGPGSQTYFAPMSVALAEDGNPPNYGTLLGSDQDDDAA